MDKKKKPFVFETADPISYDLLRQYAEENKLVMTEAEHALWDILKNKGIGQKFRRQHIIGNYIADFVNLHYKIVVEIDGKYHFYGNQPISDALRTEALNGMGYTVVRFTNDEVLHQSGLVVNQLKDLFRHMEISFPKQNKPAVETTIKSVAPQSQKAPLPLEGLGEAVDRRASWAVDAACSGNPGPMEYQCVDLQTGEQVFHYGPVWGTNNIGEFLAIVHALALMEQRGIKDKVIYSDSYNAILWVKKKQCKTKLERNAKTEQLYQVIARAENWLRTHPVTTPVIKWETKKWGEIPADFGRK